MVDEASRIERSEERLVARTAPVLKGRVRVERRVSEVPASIEVDVSRHELSLTRHPVDRPLAPGETTVATSDGTTVVLVTEERLEVRKVPWVVEEIHLSRREVTERRSVTDMVRHETFDIQTDGDVHINSNPRVRK